MVFRAIVLATAASAVCGAACAQAFQQQPSAQPAAGDRYGPPAAWATTAAPPPAASAGYAASQGYAPRPRGRFLAWPGKAMASAPSIPGPAPLALRSAPASYRYPAAAAPGRAYPSISSAQPSDGGAPYGAAAPRTAPQAYAAAPAYGRAPAASQDGWTAVPLPPGRGGPALSGAPLPTSIYGAASPSSRAAAAPAPVQTASAARRYGYDPTTAHTVRFYSVHRPFGIRPDPAPIPPQFFTATADLAQPPGPLPTERTTESTGAGASRTVRAAPDVSTGG